MAEKIGIAVIGYGGMGQYHAGILSKHGSYIVTGVYDIDSAANERAAYSGLKVFDSPHEVASDGNTRAVLIATPNDVHCHYTEFFAAHKKHVLCEKPVACSLAEASAMYDACQNAGVVFMVNQNRRVDKDFLTVKEIVRQGEIGECYLFESRVMGSNGIPGDWRKEARHGGGMMLDWGVHLIDQVNLLAGDELPDSLYCTMSNVLGFEVDDGFKLTLFYKKFRAEITVDTNSFTTLPRWMVYGKNGTAIIQNWDLEGGIVMPGKTPAKIKGIVAGNGFTKTMAYRTAENSLLSGLPEVKEDPLYIYNSFYDAVSGKAEAVVRRSEVLHVFAIMEKAFESARHNRTVKLILD